MVVGREVVGREVVGREGLFVVGWVGSMRARQTKTNVNISNFVISDNMSIWKS